MAIIIKVRESFNSSLDWEQIQPYDTLPDWSGWASKMSEYAALVAGWMLKNGRQPIELRWSRDGQAQGHFIIPLCVGDTPRTDVLKAITFQEFHDTAITARAHFGGNAIQALRSAASNQLVGLLKGENADFDFYHRLLAMIEIAETWHICFKGSQPQPASQFYATCRDAVADKWRGQYRELVGACVEFFGGYNETAAYQKIFAHMQGEENELEMLKLFTSQSA